MISIIIPVYNGQVFIQNAYKLLLGQKLDNFEIIFVDNNSTDGSVAIVLGLMKNDERIQLYHETKQGAAAARNKGLTKAKGDYIYFFDVDDELFDGAILALKDVLECDETLDSVFGRMLRSSISIENSDKPNDETLQITVKEPPYYGLIWFDNVGKLQGTPSFLHRKRVFDVIGNFNEDLRLGEDASLFIKLGMTSRIAYLDRYIYVYIRHPNSTVSKQNDIEPKEFTYWPRIVIEHLSFYFNNKTPLEYKKILYSKLFGYMPKMLAKTRTFKKRLQLHTQLKNDIKPLKTPIFLEVIISMVKITGSLNLYKLYHYYIFPKYLKWFVK